MVGYCDDDSLMVIKNCHNAGSISKESGESGVVSVPEFIESRASSDKGINLNSIESLTSDMVGGIVGVNLPNHVIDGCSNSGNLSGFTGLGGVVGLNMGRIFDCSLTENFGNAGLSYIGGIAGINVNANNKNTRRFLLRLPLQKQVILFFRLFIQPARRRLLTVLLMRVRPRVRIR